MGNVFEVLDKSGRKIRLTNEQWTHIMRGHPQIVDAEILKAALVRPSKVKVSKYDSCVVWYYLYVKDVRRYLFVAVKYLNGEGFVITSFYVKDIK